MKKKIGVILAFVAVILMAIVIYFAITYETPEQKMDKALKGIQINVDDDDLDVGKRIIEETTQSILDSYAAQERFKEENDKMIQDIKDKLRDIFD